MEYDTFPLRIRYEYEQTPGITPQYAHGVWGGINSQGEVEINFYTESDKLPPYSERLVAADGSFGHEMSPQENNIKIITRHIHTKVILKYHTARDILDWLAEKVETLDMEGEASAFDFDGETDREH